jgi:hypothetical protein
MKEQPRELFDIMRTTYKNPFKPRAAQKELKAISSVFMIQPIGDIAFVPMRAITSVLVS